MWKREKPNWGARKIRERLLRRLPSEVKVPAHSTIHAILGRHGLVARVKRSSMEGTPLSAGLRPNALWCTDYKGEFKLGNQRYCYPLTVTDHASRYLLLCEAMESNQEQFAFTAFERLFKERGLPLAIRSDNGVPFASPNGLFNLSRLSVWWLRLGIRIERIRPGHPQQNGRHERMHLTLKREATRPAGANLLQQQAKFGFCNPLSRHRRTAVSVSRQDRRRHPLRSPLPLSQKNQLSTCLTGQAVGIKEVDDGFWLVSFMQYDLRYVDLEEKTLQPSKIPSGQKCSGP